MVEIDVNEDFLSLLWILASVYLFSHKKNWKMIFVTKIEFLTTKEINHLLTEKNEGTRLNF